MKIISQGKTRVVTSLISRGSLWGHYFNKMKETKSSAMKVVCLSQLKFLNEDRVTYYKQKGLI